MGENPYVGPRTFTRKEATRFFGREREARELLSLVIAERMVLFYAQSGAGKSSLLNTRLIPQLRESGYLVLPTGRVGGELPDAVQDVANVYVFNLLLALDQSHDHQQGDLRHFAHLSLVEFMRGLRTADGEHYVYDETLAAETAAATGDAEADETQPPHVLIIDQFEEIVTTHPTRWRERAEFFRQLDEAMAADPLLWVVLTLREDFVATLDPYKRLVAGGMRARFYMQRMGVDAALEAVCRPAEAAGRPFAAGVAEKLVDNLRQVRLPGQQQFHLGQYVEPVQLQVVCFQLWENLKDQPLGLITETDLTKAGDVDTALADFYEDALTVVLDDPELTVPEQQLRNWFDTQLITESGTRGTVYQGDETTAGMPNSVVRRLQDRFLLRAEVRAGGTWIELIHDRFVGPIQQANRRRQTPLAQDAEAWRAAAEVKSHLYTGYQLEQAQRQLEEHPETLSPLQRRFIEMSVRQDQRRVRRNRRLITTGSLLAILLLTAVAVWSFWQQYQLNTALEERSTALVEMQIAQSTSQAAQLTAEAVLNIRSTALSIAESDSGAAAQALIEVEAQRANLASAQRTAEAQSATAQAVQGEATQLASELAYVLAILAPTPTPTPTPTGTATVNREDILDAITNRLTPSPTPDLNALITVEAIQNRVSQSQTPVTNATEAPTPVVPNYPTIPADAVTSDDGAVTLRVWNQLGDVVLNGAEAYGIDPVTLVAVIAAESVSAGFGADGRLLIRFEVHLFNEFWGNANQASFDQFFRFDVEQPWRDHQWRPSTTAEWQAVHTNQQSEWAAFELARSLNQSEDAAIRATSLGSPQMLGNNYTQAGYATPQEMLADFQLGIDRQINALLRYLAGAGLTEVLAAGDINTFTRIYNGTGSTEVYETQIRNYEVAFESLFACWVADGLYAIVPPIELSLFAQSSPTATVLRRFGPGRTLRVDGFGAEQWIRVTSRGGEEGWMRGQYMTYCGDVARLPADLAYRSIQGRDDLPFLRGVVVEEASQVVQQIVPQSQELTTYPLRYPEPESEAIRPVAVGTEVTVLRVAEGPLTYGSGQWLWVSLVDPFTSAQIVEGWLPAEVVVRR